LQKAQSIKFIFNNSLEITLTHSYPSNISPEQFDKIKPILESARKKTRPRSIDLYDVFCGVLYVLKLHMVIIAFAVLLMKKL